MLIGQFTIAILNSRIRFLIKTTALSIKHWHIISRIGYCIKKLQSYFVSYKKDNSTEIKYQVLKLVNESIVTYLPAMEMAKPDEFGETCSTVARIIADNNERVRRRLNGNKDEDDDIGAN